MTSIKTSIYSFERLGYVIGMLLFLFIYGCSHRPLSEQSCALIGRIVSEENIPIVGAQVFVTLSGTESLKQSNAIYTAMTDTEGRFNINGVPVLEGAFSEIDVKARGYQTLYSPESLNDTKLDIILRRGVVELANIRLRKGHYFSGMVVDELGDPIGGAYVTPSGLNTTEVDESGRFEIYDVSTERNSIVSMYIGHPNFISEHITNILEIPEEKRDQIRIVLKSGCRVEGILINPDGTPMPSSWVKISDPDNPNFPYKSIITDDRGRFSIMGISPGSYLLSATTLASTGKMSVDITQDTFALILRLTPANNGHSPSIQFLGLTLVEANDSLAAHWGVKSGNVIVLDLGKENRRFAGSKLQVGSHIIGIESNNVDKPLIRIGSLLALISTIVNQVERQSQKVDSVSVNLIASFQVREGRGTTGVLLQLSDSDIKEARAVMKAIEKAKP